MSDRNCSVPIAGAAKATTALTDVPLVSLANTLLTQKSDPQRAPVTLALLEKTVKHRVQPVESFLVHRERKSGQERNTFLLEAAFADRRKRSIFVLINLDTVHVNA
jgi:hypothetical protein